MTHFYEVCSAVLTCVGTGSSLGSMSKGRRKQFLEVFLPRKDAGESGPYCECLVSVGQMASSPGNAVVRLYLQVPFDGHAEQSLKQEMRQKQFLS